MRRRPTRRTTLATLLVLVVAACAFAVGASSATAGAARYIVVFKNGVSDPDAAAKDHGRRYGVSVTHVYRHALKGYAGAISDSRVDAVRRDSRVAYVERDGTVSAVAKPPWAGGEDSTASAQTLPWGIDKVEADLSSTRAGDGTGAITNASVYIIDTGADAGHQDLNVVNHVNFASGPNKDCHGHGTHVAGTVAAKDNAQDVVGVAPGAPITGVKVLGCGGSGTTSGVISGIDWVTGNANKPAIANMSLGGGASQALDDAVKTSADSGVFYSIAAGNDGANACNYSPARAGTHNGVSTTAATDSNDEETSWSNYGSCVDIWAPGASILSTKSGGGTTTMSGTSMAAPHVGGGGALYLSSHTGASPATVESSLKNAAETTASKSKDGTTITRLDVGGF